jgi:hypothetical protein
MGDQREPLVEIEEETIGCLVEDQYAPCAKQKSKDLCFPVAGIAGEK